MNVQKIYYDTETTGFKPGSICQIAYIIEDEQFNVLGAKNKFFQIPEKDYKNALEAAKITGLTPEKLLELSGGHTFSEQAQEIYNDFQGKANVAHNIDFDESFLSTELWRNDIVYKPAARYDTMKIFTDICRLPRTSKRGKGDFKYPKLSEVAGYYNLNAENTLKYAKILFGDTSDEITYHDARYDTTVMYIVCKLRAEQLNGYGDWTRIFKRQVQI